jgi:hypothetical protein
MAGNQLVMGTLAKTFAVSQVIRCAKKSKMATLRKTPQSRAERNNMMVTLWEGCGREDNALELTLMGYSVRTMAFRYTAYIQFNRTLHRVSDLDRGREGVVPVYEELYDHRRDHNISLHQREMVNIAKQPKYKEKCREMLAQLVTYLKRRPPAYFIPSPS